MIGEHNNAMKKHDKNAMDDLKYTGSTQYLEEMLSEAVLKAKNDVLNEVLESLQGCGKRLYISILEHLEIGGDRSGKQQKSNK